MGVEFGRTAQDYARYRVGFPSAFFDALQDSALLQPGMRALDLGTGTGLLARELARRGLVVTGLDCAGALLVAAKHLDDKAGVSVRYVEQTAESMAFEGQSFDLVLAGQCWHWFDRPKVLSRIHDVLSPTGSLVIAHFDWLPHPGSVVEATEALIQKYSPDWELGGGDGRYPQWMPGLREGGFQDLEISSFEMDVPYRAEAWRGRIRASAGVAASLTAPEVKAFDKELKEKLCACFGEDPLRIPHRMWWLRAKRCG